MNDMIAAIHQKFIAASPKEEDVPRFEQLLSFMLFSPTQVANNRRSYTRIIL